MLDNLKFSQITLLHLLLFQSLQQLQENTISCVMKNETKKLSTLLHTQVIIQTHREQEIKKERAGLQDSQPRNFP